MRSLITLLAVLLFTTGALADPEVEWVDLNRANVSELCTLPGVGPKRAQSIIDYREKRRFTRVSQLLNIRGIGRKTLRRLRPLVVVQPRSLKAKPRPRATPARKAR